MPHIDDLIRALDELLDPAAFDDYGPNGLQVPGRLGGASRGDGRVRPASRSPSARSSWARSSSSSITACSGSSCPSG